LIFILKKPARFGPQFDNPASATKQTAAKLIGGHMKSYINTALIFAWILSFAPSKLPADVPLRSTGINFRTSYWVMPDPQNHVISSFPNGTTRVDVGGAGGWLSLLKRVNERTLVEISFGGVGNIKGESESNNHNWSSHHNSVYDDEEDKNNFDINAITPILFGLRMFLTSPRNSSGLMPYVSGGAGPYCLADIQIRDDGAVQETTTDWTIKGGAYFGGGCDIYLSRWLALNIDARYHLVDFDTSHKYSNMECGVGLQVMWGSWK
jgi:hypothetical protein